MKSDLIFGFLVSAIAGVAVWALSPLIAGTAEPWDAESFYYAIALLVVGLLFGLVRPRRFWICYPGVFSGQLIYMLLFLPLGPLIPIGVVFLLGYSLLSFAGAAVGAGIRRLVRRFAGSESAP